MTKTTKGKATGGKSQRTWQGVFFQEHPADSPTLFWVFSSLILAFVVIISICQIQSLDLWWHLKTGAWISQQHAIPKADPFSFSAAGKPWVSHEWLFGWLSYMVYQIGGVTALIWAKASLIAVLFLLATWTARARGAFPGMMFLVLTVAYYISRTRFTERPELISLPLALGFIFLFVSSEKRPWIILLAPCLELLWANIHGGTAILGWGLSGAFLIDCAWRLRDQRTLALELIKNKRLQLPLLSFAGTILASLVNPHGFKAIFYGLLRTESPLDIKEFQSLAAMMNQGMDPSIILLYVAFAVLLALFMALRPKDVRVYEWILIPALLLLSIKFFRFRNFFVFLSAPVLSMQLSRVKWLSRLHWRWPAMAGLLIMLLAVSMVRSSYSYRFGMRAHEGLFPVEAANFIQENKLAGRMFNSYTAGGYLVWELWPEHKVFIDGREDVYLEPGVLDDYTRCFNSRSDWQNVVDKYDIDFAVVRYPEQAPTRPDDSLDTLAFPRNEWGLVYFDDVVAIYIRRNGKNDLVLREKEIRMVQPFQLSSYLDGIISDPEKLLAFSKEMDANLRDHPSSYRAHSILGVLAVKSGPQHFQQAIQEFEQVVALNPEFSPAYINLGSIYMYLGRLDDAKHSFQKALSLGKNSLAEEQLRRLRSRRQ
jgi:hypothetical protein